MRQFEQQANEYLLFELPCKEFVRRNGESSLRGQRLNGHSGFSSFRGNAFGGASGFAFGLYPPQP